MGSLQQWSSECSRVQNHLALATARMQPSDGLTELQRLVRSLLLDALREYREIGIFPQNPSSTEQLPIFIDANNTRCAMAHLLELGGEHELVARIARERNNAWVHELADEPRLLAWLAAAGLSVQEAAAIQPSYCGSEHHCVCNPFAFNQRNAPVRDIFVARVTQDAGSAFSVQAEVTQTFGVDGGVVVGQSVTLSLDPSVGGRGGHLLGMMPAAGLNGAPGSAVGFTLDQNGEWNCQFYSRRFQPVSPTLAARALLSGDCPGTLIAADPSWARDPCPRMDGGSQMRDASVVDEGGAVVPSRDASVLDDGGGAVPSRDASVVDDGARAPLAVGCSVPAPGDGAPTSLGILLSIASFILTNRRQVRARVIAKDPTHAKEV